MTLVHFEWKHLGAPFGPTLFSVRVLLVGLIVALQACGGGGGTTAIPDPSVAPASVNLTEMTTGLATPWSLAFLPDGRMLVTERPGTLKLLSPSGSIEGSISGVPAVVAQGQGGLLDVVLDPAFATNRRIYLSYAERDPADPALNGTAVARAVLDVDALSLSSVAVIYRQRPKVASSAHFGARLVFDRTGALFITMGERLLDSERGFAQDLTRGHGKIVRITTDGVPAPGNPVWTEAGAQPEIYSLGHRNPQGAALHPDTGELWISEHGAQGGDEINRVLAGRNYAVPQWRGNLFVTALWRLTLSGNTVTAQERLLASRGERLRDVRQGPDGALYLLTDNGKLLRYGV